MTERAVAREALLAQAGWSAAVAAPLAGDASSRRYERLSGGPGGSPAVLMDAPPGPTNDTRRFTALTDYLRSLGLSAPEILGADHAAGFLLLEDLGDDLFAHVAKRQPSLEPEIYRLAVDLLASLADSDAPHTLPPVYGKDDASVEIPDYDAEFLRFEAGLFTEWWWPAAAGEAPSNDLTAEYRALMDSACAPVAETRDALVLRDFHAENLLWLPERPGLAAVGLLDYQDARRGHPAYDLVSLLEDARRDVPRELARDLQDAYATTAGFSPAEREAFNAAYAILGAQRNLKIVGIFTRLHLRDGKPGYLPLIPRVWAHLMHDLEHPALVDLRNFVRATRQRRARRRSPA